jgi:hypothetical protein
MAVYEAKSTRPVRKPHPLIGKLVRLNSEDFDYYCVSRFTADLGDGFLLARRLNPLTGRELANSHIVALGLLAQPEMAEIYDEWAAVPQEMPPDEERIIRLVPKE